MRRLKGCKKVAISLLVVLLALVVFSGSNSVYAAGYNKGVALKGITNVYSDTTKSSQVLRSYSEGTILLYLDYSRDWYSAVVFINGVRKTGYIHKADVETSVDKQEGIKGIGISQTPIYAKASTGSKQIRSYVEGSILYYKTFTSEWYEALVYINGVAKSGYIHKSHVENISGMQENLKGIGLGSPTIIYGKPSTNSNHLRKYNEGSILYYKTLSNNWYQALVYVNGVATTGYIYKADVENIVDKQIGLKGIGLENPTAVYSRASTNARAIRSYAAGSILHYKTLSKNWYEALVYVNGKATKGYIYSSHVEEVYTSNESLDGVTLKAHTNIYTRASTRSRALASMGKGSYVQISTFSPNWFTANVTVNGKAITGYIHQNDVSTDRVITKTTQYSTDYNSAVDIQMGRAPQVSGESGGWVSASRPQVEYYINSSNFGKSSKDYYQFLVLSQPASLDAEEVNQNILNNHGTLTGTAQAFIDAGASYDVNEAYLISHALLETGNGRSALARGVPVDSKGKVVSAKDAVSTVYNMYGIGAVDSCPIECGAKKAFDEGWATPEEAIIGGAKFINTYIARGQDTLYKMRWNPINPGHPQYATDIAWTVKQTSNIKRIYDLLDRYVLVYDVPKYINQPAKSGDPDYYDIGKPNSGTTIDYPSEVYGVTSTPINLNLREEPSTSSGVMGSIPSGSKIELLGTNGTWYKVTFGGKIGWAHGGYITILNLLEVSTGNSTLGIRPDPNTSNTTIERVDSGTLLAGILDKHNKLIRSNEWYQISYDGKEAWISGGTNGAEYIKINN
ncbi:SH3 domain-containing protein [Sporosarcina sp. G11-34]|uniref:SH3 domain-containing protein n=1 Tax=Sporosarcina sp. G11-34 TaxID=2849605 RepID=UPI0022A951C5|nr:SH3 domain-containing protein [Sporosarcina sp. G11-34]MCZ2258657.1 SH3 domain-containing protein [Sporosarcina sp. G11-34]